jgi:hypothetical protein
MGGRGNKVIKVKITKCVTGKKKACNLLGPILSSKGFLGAGFLVVSDALGYITAFCGRSMSKQDDAEPAVVKDFIEFSKKFVDKFIIPSTPLVGTPEPEKLKCFQDNNKGKKPMSYINMVTKNFELHKQGKAEKKFYECGGFVKDENSAKKDSEGVIRPRHRLIMTMSMYYLVCLSPVLLIIDAWNHGPFAEFQVKGDVGEAWNKINELSSQDHTVTDYSSFEGSITPQIRQLETYTLTRLCQLNHFDKTSRHIRRFCNKDRTLVFRGVGKAKIVTRCSGDYWTSMGNGLVNVCVNQYGAFLKSGVTFEQFQPIRMVAEGDDGFLETRHVNHENTKKLGFSFSSALSGSSPGDCDFLSRRWINGKFYMNVAKCLKVLWIRKGLNLSIDKQMYLLRCSANSIHHMCPGHPILSALVHRIGVFTEGATDFKNSSLYLDGWSKSDVLKTHGFPREYYVDESMRLKISEGTAEFPPISIAMQLELEKRILNDEIIYIGSILDEYPEVEIYQQSFKYIDPKADEHEPVSPNLKEVVEMLESAGVVLGNILSMHE